MPGREALDRLLGLQRFGIQPGLERIRALLEPLGHPEARMAILHVTGTNGKGSVAAIAAAILRAAGHRVGLYTSPHLLDFRERIEIDGRPIPDTDLLRHLERLLPLLDRVGSTFFEASTALALLAFAEAGVRLAVLEVGMGGRWDATNVGTPVVSVITRIDYDHEAYLGDTLPAIAREKAAIIRGGTALSARQAPEVAAVIAARCQAVGVPLLVEGRELSVEVVRSDLGGQRLHLAGPGWAHRDVELALLGTFQPANACLAVGAAHLLDRAGFPVPEPALRAGLAGVRWPGRFEIVRKAPWLVLDSAHNPGGARALAASLRHYFPEARRTLVVGISADKNKAGILEALAPLAARVLLVASSSPRATPPEEMARLLPPLEAEVACLPTVGQALELALADPGAEVVCVTGSIFLVGDVLRWLGSAGPAP